jgi:retron-type reverse transcriptase
MRRVGNLWAEVSGLDNLFRASHQAARGKRNRPDVARFLCNLETEVFALHRELLASTYKPGGYRTFIVDDGKPRQISAASFRDRVVHHALTRVLEPIFERRFTADSYACRKGYGTHRALARARAAARRCRFVLKCDVSKYFASIDHQILVALLGRVVKCRPTIELAARIIEGSNPQQEVVAYFPGDDLFTPYQRRRGLPLGNQTSQFFANVYLNPFDHFVRRQLETSEYMRYVDDFLLFGDDKQALGKMGDRIAEWLCRLRIQLHPRKTRVYRTQDGVTFLGWRIFPDRMRLVRANVVRCRRRLRKMQRDFLAGRLTWAEVHPRIRSWIAHAAHGDTWKLREQVLAQHVFRRGNAT